MEKNRPTNEHILAMLSIVGNILRARIIFMFDLMALHSCVDSAQMHTYAQISRSCSRVPPFQSLSATTHWLMLLHEVDSLRLVYTELQKQAYIKEFQ